jgi:hypothetical protein
VWTALNTSEFDSKLLSNNKIFGYQKVASGFAHGDGFGKLDLLLWLMFAYLGSNTTPKEHAPQQYATKQYAMKRYDKELLNVYWLAKVVHLLRK